MFQLLVNRFIILEVEKYTNNDSDLSDALVCLSTISIALTKYPKWKKDFFYTIMIAMSYTLYSIDIYLVFNMTQIYTRIYFISDSYLLCFVFFSYFISQYLV